MHKYLILFAFTFLHYFSLAQSIQLTGVIAAGNHKLPSASIQLKSFKNADLLIYGFSDDHGNYYLKGQVDQSDKFLLIAAYVGYKRDTLIILRNQLFKQPVFQYNFSLIEDKNQLDEVYIKAPNPVQVNNDTTKYNVQQFTNPEDKNLESVLKKMPGMDVNKDGTIFFKGKKISKVLLEGDDLTGEGYKAITKNLKPEFVNEVQALEHYVEDNLLKGIINSDDIVLNLKIQNKKARKIIGSTDAGLGTIDRRMLSTNLISFIDKTKAFAFANHSNSNSESNNHVLNLVDENRKFTGNNQIIRHEIDTYNSFDATLYPINNTTQGSLNAITRVSDNFKVNYSLLYSWSKLSGETSMQNTYFPPNSIYTEDNDHRTSFNKTLKADVSADYLVKKNARLWVKLTYTQEPKKFSSTAFSIYNKIVGDSVLQAQNELNKNLNGQFKYTIKVNTKTAYLFSAKILLDDVKQDYKTSSALYQSIPLFRGAKNLLQTVNNQNFKLKLDFEGLQRYNKTFLYLNAGNEINYFRLKSNLLPEPQDNQKLIADIFTNNNLFKVNQSYIDGKYVYDNQKIKLQTQLKSTLQVLRNMGKDSTYFILEPSLSFSYKLSEIQSISLSYNYRNTNPQPIEYYENYILTDLRNLNGGLTNFYNYNTQLLGVNYSFNDFFNSYFNFNVSANGSYSKYGFLYTNLFINTLNYVRKEPYKGVKTLSANLSVKKFSPVLLSTITASYAPSYATYYSSASNSIQEYGALGQLLMFKISTGFNLPVNFGIGVESQSNKTTSEQHLIAKTNAYKYTFDYRYRISERIFNYSSYNLYRMNNGNFNLIDTEFQYNPVKGIFKYSLQGKNLANLKAFTMLNINEVASSNYSSSILGRYVMINLSMSIK